ncbi:MAG: hypothetical protein ACD_58C00072G0005 [uncultured bacterium]|nr:MAG: hypothetical protein ACD_58C00072G0005 [uncultured bacterium]
MMKIINYYFNTSFRRKSLDKLLKKNVHLFRGTVLDIGGRDRGNFKKPKISVQKWIFLDIQEKNHPDLVQDVANMHDVKSKTVDVVCAIELFEHVRSPEAGLNEIYRILKKNGTLILSCPFLFPIHGDPDDWQRWTESKWMLTLNNLKFEKIYLQTTGLFFTTLNDMLLTLLNDLPIPFNKLKYLFLPLLSFFTVLDRYSFTATKRLKNFHNGYFIIATK